MKNRIKIDFEVKEISENGKETLFLKVENLFYKFVWVNKIDSFNRLEQFYILRYELANYIKSYFDSNTLNSTFLFASGEEVKFKGNKEILEINLKTHFSDTFFHIRGNNEFINTLLKDFNVLEEKTGNLTSKRKDKLLSKFVEDRFHNEEIINKLTNQDFEIIQFEKTISKNKSCYGLSDIYKTFLNKNLSDTNGLKFNLMQNFKFVYNSDSCDCGQRGCFFEILKENQLYFLKNSYLNENGAVDTGKVEEDFDEIWSALSISKKASIMFLYNEFDNSTLLNLAFVNPNFNLMNYQFLMCYPYQPDSEEEKMVREVSTLSNFFIQLEKK